uniref:Uncharacterized protein n=1 Tax=Amphimedon queenslandica TaxID=400682 RepID=A0A1X7VJK5_AMPQE
MKKSTKFAKFVILEKNPLYGSNFIEISTVDTSINTGNELKLESESHDIQSAKNYDTEANDVDHVVHTSCSMALQRDPSLGLEDMKKYQDEFEELKKKNETLKKDVHLLEFELKERYINEEYFKDNDKKLLLTLMKWRLNLHGQDLAYQSMCITQQ